MACEKCNDTGIIRRSNFISGSIKTEYCDCNMTEENTRCQFEVMCSKSMCDNYKYLTTRPSGAPRCDAFREKSNNDSGISIVFGDLDD